MNIIILTGSIASGKSAVLAQFKKLGFVGLNADVVVHELLAQGGEAVMSVAEIFPESTAGKGKTAHIDRVKLGKIVFNDAKKLTQLEQILHPLVRKSETEWLKKQRRLGRKNVVIEIPLFFESRWRKNQNRYSTVITTSASPWASRQRALKRPHMTSEKLMRIKQRQWPAAKKATFADATIHTGLGYAHAMRQIKNILK